MMNKNFNKICTYFPFGGLILLVWLLFSYDIIDLSALFDQFNQRSLLESHHVMHKDLFPLDTRDWWGTILVIIGTMIAASGGIGGSYILILAFRLLHQLVSCL